MSHNWQNRNEPGGILRKNYNANNAETKPIDLLVFGYACKVFRDDQKALQIDQGKHLIPWMGDSSLKIDRYDVRATLYDLSPHEPPPGGYGNRLAYLSAEEQRAELLCEEERYRCLYHNEEEEKLYQEEEFKRLQTDTSSAGGYNQVQFSYGASQNVGKDDDEDSKSDEIDEPFVVPQNLNVPEGLELPETMKEHAIIEKTAKFISAEGMQMEIFIKAKQSNNAQFEFLMQNHRLNAYYKFVLNAFKTNTYPMESQNIEASTQETVTNDVITAVIPPRPAVHVPKIKYTPSADCAYTQLISKIKGLPLPPEQPQGSENNFNPVMQYNSPYYTTNENSQESTEVANETMDKKTNNGVDVKMVSNALLLAQAYSSGSDGEDDEEPPPLKIDFPIPPTSLQNIIDKTALYVIKNGRQFEETLRAKGDDRFLFLYPENEFHSYYMYKITGVPKNYLKAAKKAPTGPVSFSIKAKDDGPQKPPALNAETSDDENSGNKTKAKANNIEAGGNSCVGPQRPVPEHVQKAIQLVESQLLKRNSQAANNSTHGSQNTKSKFDVPPSSMNRSVSDMLTDSAKLENQQKNRLKRAEEKVKDKLAQIAREKLGLISKEKQLQLERKKKAMAFLTQLKETSSGPATNTDNTNKSSTNTTSANHSDSDSSSVHSIPISCYGDKSDESENECNRENELELVIIPKSRSRSRIRVSLSPEKSKSRSRSTSRSTTRHKSKKHKSKHSKKKHKKRKSKSRSRSRDRHRSRKRERSNSVSSNSSPEKKRSHKSKKRDR